MGTVCCSLFNLCSITHPAAAVMALKLGCQTVYALFYEWAECHVKKKHFDVATATLLQAVVVTDPVLATAVLRSRDLDKLRFHYSFLDPVSCLACGLSAAGRARESMHDM